MADQHWEQAARDVEAAEAALKTSTDESGAPKNRAGKKTKPTPQPASSAPDRSGDEARAKPAAGAGKKTDKKIRSGKKGRKGKGGSAKPDARP